MKYIIDTDPGIDDAIAICMGYLNKLDIIGFTLATGNVETEKSANNLKVIQDFLKSNIKMYKGTIENVGDRKTAMYAHGYDGLGYAVFPKNNRQFERGSAENFIIKASKKYRDNLTIICLGPLTNLASAIKKDPNLVKRVSRVVIMGASYNPRNKKLYREFNIGVDVDSANLVLSAGFKDVRIVTHEIGVKAFIEKDYMLNLRDSDNIVSRFVGVIALKYMDFSKDHYNVSGLCSPDPITMAYVIDEEIVKFKPCVIKIADGKTTAGESHITFEEESNIFISYRFDEEKYRKLFKGTFN